MIHYAATHVALSNLGQMLYMKEWNNMMLYLSNPIMPDIDSLMSAGLVSLKKPKSVSTFKIIINFRSLVHQRPSSS